MVQNLKHYTIESTLGTGGMGIVYLARDTKLQRLVAIKLLKPELVSDPNRKSRFLREARAAAALTHPAIAQVYDIDEVDGTTFIVMEYIDGRTIGRLIRDGELDLIGAVEIACQVAEGLAKAHDSGIIHRDIKSDNIMVTKDGHAKLLDFGLAKLLEADTDMDTAAADPADLTRTRTQDRTQTMPGAVMGTITYMSPEQARGQELSPASDIFSFGIVLYEMVAGERPFKGDTPLDTMHSIAFEEPKPVTLVKKNIPPQLHRIITRCLRKRREDRYPNAHALADDLKGVKQELESGTRTRLPAGTRLLGWIEWLKTSFPYGPKGVAILVAALIVSAVFLLTKLQWGNMIGPAVAFFFIYRALRNKRQRMLKAFVKKVSALPEVRAIVIKDDTVTVALDKAPAKTYIRITSLIDEINEKRFIGKQVMPVIRDDLSEAEFRNLLKTAGVTYARDE
ncbi:MAG: serine/threonine-protein kinase [Candidatus Aminicenantes bacterium]|nr:serine/threonine-protein kinase [Candidatus Aminicenantes bacterium]